MQKNVARLATILTVLSASLAAVVELVDGYEQIKAHVIELSTPNVRHGSDYPGWMRSRLAGRHARAQDKPTDSSLTYGCTSYAPSGCSDTSLLRSK